MQSLATRMNVPLRFSSYLWKNKWTRKHSSRMRPPENHPCFSFSGHNQMLLGRSPNEKVWTGLQWSPADVTSRGQVSKFDIQETLVSSGLSNAIAFVVDFARHEHGSKLVVSISRHELSREIEESKSTTEIERRKNNDKSSWNIHCSTKVQNSKNVSLRFLRCNDFNRFLQGYILKPRSFVHTILMLL